MFPSFIELPHPRFDHGIAYRIGSIHLPNLSVNFPTLVLPALRNKVTDSISHVAGRSIVLSILNSHQVSIMNKPESDLSHLSDDDYAADKTYESRFLGGESGSDNRDEEKHGNICNGKTNFGSSFTIKIS
ncbi:hypothetical protein TNCV_4430431 [Trichonephila clavipes]|nr:hypothetical protein TNCV_4430431 [Trichonephila clavipes]